MMNQKERKLFKSLCSFKNETLDESLLEEATPAVLGHLFFNRMQAIAYDSLKKHEAIGKVNREFRNSLKNAYVLNKEKNESFIYCVEYLGKVLSKVECHYAMLKGAYLCGAYPLAYRTSNDIDLLVHPKNVTEIGRVLLDAGFKQGNISKDKFKPATRKEIIESKMMRGETIPYIKEINMPRLQFLEVDINFSLDYKPAEVDVLEEIMENSCVEELSDYRVKTLNKEDFFVHLCAHLYKEATTLPWVEMMRDMSLYKYCDIYMIIDDAPMEYVDFLFKRATHLGMDKICAFAILQMSRLLMLKIHM